MTEVNKKDSKELKKEEYSPELVKRIETAANYCYSCNRCVNVCPLSHLGVFSPRKLINDLNFLSLEEALENNNIWDCLTCGQCTVYCPMTKDKKGVKIPELILELRELARDFAPEQEKLVQCETHDGMFPLIAKIQAENPNPPNKLDFINEVGLKVKKEGDLAFFVGCLPIMEDVIFNFDIEYTSIPKTIIGLLNEAQIAPVVLNEKCCGHDIFWGKGDKETFKKLAEYNVKLYRDAGVKKIIFGCAEGYKTWKLDYPKVIEDFDFEIVHFSEFFLQENILENIRFPGDRKIKVTYHDACRLGRLGDKLYDAPRKLIESIPGVELVEMENVKDDASCCGVSAFSGCNEYTRFLRRSRIEEAVETGADYLLVPCPKCLTHFNCYLSEPSENPKHKELKNKIKVVDLASFIGELLFMA